MLPLLPLLPFPFCRCGSLARLAAHTTMIPWLESTFPVRVTTHPTRGRCVVAARALPAGTPILACAPAAFHPLRNTRCCHACLAPAASLRVCAACKAAAYCSPECQKAAWRAHRGECAHQAWLWAPAHEPGREPVGGDADGTTLLLLSRIHRGLGLRGGGGGGDGAGAGAGAGAAVYVHCAADVAGMASRAPAQAPALAAHLERAIDIAGRQGLWVPVPPAAAPATASPAALLRTALALDVNDFSVTDELFVPRAAGVYPLGALLNHSCAPNCAAVYVTAQGAAAALAPALAGEAPAAAAAAAAAATTPAANPTAAPEAPVVQVFRTLAPVAEGEELCHSYVDLALPRAARAAYLQASYGFVCKCASCSGSSGGGGGGGGDTDALLLGRACADFFVAAPAAADAAPAEAPDRRFWADLPPRVPVGVPATDGSGGLASDWAGIPRPLRAELATAMELLAAGRFSERAGGKDALAAFPVRLDAEALWRVKRAAAGHSVVSAAASSSSSSSSGSGGGAGGEGEERGGFPALGTGMALALGREAWALEGALARLRPLLHPFHVLTHSAVAAAFDKYVALGDAPGAAAACEHLCAFYAAVYSAVCGAHPMLALQLFSLGDMYARLAELAEGAGAGGGGGGGGGSAPPAGGEPGAAGEGAPPWALWRPSPARAAALAALFVQRAGELCQGASAAGTLPARAPFPQGEEGARECAARWRRAARAAHAECARLLAIAYGPAHRLTVQAAALAGSA